MNRVGTAHGVGLSKLTTKVKTSKGIKTVMDEGVFIGDATTKQSRQSHVVVRAVQVLGSKAVSLTYNYITDGKKLATENRASKWVCQPMSLLNRIPEWTPITFGLVVKQTKANTAKTVGSLIFQGTPVWHVLLKSQAKKNDAKQVIELLIDQKTNLVKSMKILNSGISKGEPWTESMALGLTKFGEPVKVTLPAGC
jgi:hypothetical protein